MNISRLELYENTMNTFFESFTYIYMYTAHGSRLTDPARGITASRAEDASELPEMARASGGGETFRA